MKRYRILLMLVLTTIAFSWQSFAGINFYINSQVLITTPIDSNLLDSIENRISISVQSIPDSAVLFLNDSLCGNTPIEVKARFGTKKFTLIKPGFQKYESNFLVSSKTNSYQIILAKKNEISPEIYKYLPHDKDYIISELTEDDEIKIQELMKKRKFWYKAAIGSGTLALFSALYANYQYHEYETARENVDQLHDQIQVFDGITYFMIGVSGICIIAAESYTEQFRDLLEPKWVRVALCPVDKGCVAAITIKIPYSK